MAFWGEELPNFAELQFLPPNMTELLQVIDRHIGVRYKEYVYFTSGRS